MRGKLIVIDGTDGSGKRTQSEILLKNLRKHKIKAELLDIPVYESFTGEMVARYLRNDFGRIDPYLAAMLFAVNRFQAKEKILNWLKQDKIVVLDRYVTANQIHQSANLSPKERKKFKEWVSKLEYEVFAMPKPDLVLFMNMPVEIAISRILQKSPKDRKYAFGAKKDLLESDLVHQQQALKEVIALAKKTKSSAIIETTEGDRLLTKEEIADRIWEIVKKRFGFK